LQRTFYKEISGMEEKKGARKRLPSCLCSLFLFPFTAFLVVLVNPALPICAERGAATDGGNCLTQHLIVELRPGAVRVVIDGSVSSDPKVPRRFHRVNVCAEEQELPAILCLLPLDHLLHPVAAVKPARILHSVRGDNKQRMLRDILRSGVLMDIADVMDRTADGIQKSRAAPDGIVPVCHRLDVVDVHAVMDHLAHIVEEDCGDK